MNRSQFRSQLQDTDLTARPAEIQYRDRMVRLLDEAPDCFWRTCFPGHFTGSALVVSHDRSRALLHHHRKLDRWLQFGGHCDGEEDVLQVARREAEEESGIVGLTVYAEEFFDLDIHEIPARGNEPAHFHYDVRYLLLAPEDALEILSEESHELGWLTPQEMKNVAGEAGLLRMAEKWEALL